MACQSKQINTLVMPESFLRFGQLTTKKIEQLAVKISTNLNGNLTKLIVLLEVDYELVIFFSLSYKQPLAILATSSYSDSGREWNLTLSRHLNHDDCGLRFAFLVDDLGRLWRNTPANLSLAKPASQSGAVEYVAVLLVQSWRFCPRLCRLFGRDLDSSKFLNNYENIKLAELAVISNQHCSLLE